MECLMDFLWAAFGWIGTLPPLLLIWALGIVLYLNAEIVSELILNYWSHIVRLRLISHKC